MAYLEREEKGDAVRGTTSSNVLVNLQLDSDGKLVIGSMATPTLTAMLTALEKIDDLQQALKSQDTDELISRITDSTGTEINPAKEDGNLASILTAVELIDDLQGALKSVDTDELITRITDSSGTEINPAKEDGNLATAVTHLSAIQTAIELLDDLQGALKSVDTDELISRITDTAGNEINPAKEDGNLADVLTAVEKIDDLQGALKSVDSDELIVRITDSTGAEINPAEEDGNLADILAILENGLGLPYATHRSPLDFAAAYASSTTITLTGLPDTISDASQIVYVKQVDPTGNTSALWINGHNCTLEESGGTLTITPDDGSTPFGSDDVYEIGINFQDKAYDSTIDSLKTSEQSPLSDHYTDAVELVSAQDFTASLADAGAEIDTRSYNQLGLWNVIDINDSIQPRLMVLLKHESGGSEEWEHRFYQFKDADDLRLIRIDVSDVAFVQCQVIVDTVGATAGTITMYHTKAWVPSPVDDTAYGEYMEVNIDISDNAHTIQEVIDRRGYTHMGIQMPAAWTAADLAFLACKTSGGTFADLQDEFDNRLTIAVSAGNYYALGESVCNYLRSVPFLKLQSVDSSDPDTDVSQGDDRVIGIWLE